MSPPVPIREDLVDSDEQGAYLIGSKCSACGFVALGKREVCPDCWKADGIETVPIGRAGRLYTCTAIHTVPQGFDAPLIVGYVDLDEGPRIFAQLADDPAIDDKVELTLGVVRHDDDGTDRLGPIYRRST